MSDVVAATDRLRLDLQRERGIVALRQRLWMWEIDANMGPLQCPTMDDLTEGENPDDLARTIEEWDQAQQDQAHENKVALVAAVRWLLGEAGLE